MMSDNEYRAKLVKTASLRSDYQDYYRLKYIGDARYGELDLALKELPSTYNRFVQGVVGTPMIIEKPPVNPYVAAAIGNGVAGIGGGIVMGLAAQQKQQKYNECLQEFYQGIARIKTAEEKLGYLLIAINAIVDSEPEIELT